MVPFISTCYVPCLRDFVIAISFTIYTRSQPAVCTSEWRDYLNFSVPIHTCIGKRADVRNLSGLQDYDIAVVFIIPVNGDT